MENSIAFGPLGQFKPFFSVRHVAAKFIVDFFDTAVCWVLPMSDTLLLLPLGIKNIFNFVGSTELN